MRNWHLLTGLAVMVASGCASPRAGVEHRSGVIYEADFGKHDLAELFGPPAPPPAGDLEVVREGVPGRPSGGVARAVGRKDGKGKWLRLMIAPPKPVGERTFLSFSYHLRGASEMTVQVFDATDQDNRHVVLRGLKQDCWESAVVNFTRDGRKNDGNQTPFAAGHLVDDLFFFVEPATAGGEVELLVDDVVLFDAGGQ